MMRKKRTDSCQIIRRSQRSYERMKTGEKTSRRQSLKKMDDIFALKNCEIKLCNLKIHLEFYTNQIQGYDSKLMGVARSKKIPL